MATNRRKFNLQTNGQWENLLKDKNIEVSTVSGVTHLDDALTKIQADIESGAAQVASHTHQISDVTGLETALDNASSATAGLNSSLSAHVSNTDVHVTPQERNDWNSKETPEGAQAKVDLALGTAKDYTDTKDQASTAEIENLKVLFGMNYEDVTNIKDTLFNKMLDRTNGEMTGPLLLAGMPTEANEAATKAYVDAARTGLDFKDSVRVMAANNLPLSGIQSVDNVQTVEGDRVLVTGQTDKTQNGIYVVATGAWTRAEDADTDQKVTPGTFVFIEEGTTYGTSSFVLSTVGTIQLGTTELEFVQFSGASQISVGTGLIKTGNTLQLGTTGVTAGSYTKVTVDATGRVTTGVNPTTLAGYGITDALSSSLLGTSAGKLAVLDSNAKVASELYYTASASVLGAVKVGSNVSVDGLGTISLSDQNVLGALGTTAVKNSEKINGYAFTVGAAAPSAPSNNDIWIEVV